MCNIQVARVSSDAGRPTIQGKMCTYWCCSLLWYDGLLIQTTLLETQCLSKQWILLMMIFYNSWLNTFCRCYSIFQCLFMLVCNIISVCFNPFSENAVLFPLLLTILQSMLYNYRLLKVIFLQYLPDSHWMQLMWEHYENQFAGSWNMFKISDPSRWILSHLYSFDNATLSLCSKSKLIDSIVYITTQG